MWPHSGQRAIRVSLLELLGNRSFSDKQGGILREACLHPAFEHSSVKLWHLELWQPYDAQDDEKNLAQDLAYVNNRQMAYVSFINLDVCQKQVFWLNNFIEHPLLRCSLIGNKRCLY